MTLRTDYSDTTPSPTTHEIAHNSVNAAVNANAPDAVRCTLPPGVVATVVGAPTTVTLSNARFCHLKVGDANTLVVDRTGLYMLGLVPGHDADVSFSGLSGVTFVLAGAEYAMSATSNGSSDVTTDGTESILLYLVPLDNTDPA